jgi:hypothetical protein
MAWCRWADPGSYGIITFVTAGSEDRRNMFTDIYRQIRVSPPATL